TERYGPIVSLKKVPCPHEHRAYYPVAFVTFEGGRELVAKWDDKTEKLGKEFVVSKLLLKHGIPTTVPIDYDPSVVVLTMERLNGTVLSGYKTILSSGHAASTSREIGELLAGIHGIPAEEALAAGVPAWAKRG